MPGAIILFMTVCLFLLFIPAKILGSHATETGIVIANHLNLRPEPGLSKPPLKTLGRGAKVKILEHLDGWLKILHNKQVGYIRNREEYLSIITVEEKGTDKTIDPAGKIELFTKKAEDINQKIEKRVREVITFTRKEINTINSLNDMDLTLARAVKNVTALKSELKTLEEKIAETTTALRELEKNIQNSDEYVTGRLVALYKLNWLGRLHVLASAESICELFQRKAALKRILAYDENILQNLMDNKAGLSVLSCRLNDRKMDKLTLEANVEKQIKIMSKERDKRKRLLNDIRNKKSLEMAAIESLKQAAISLEQKIKSLSKEFLSPSAAPLLIKKGDNLTKGNKKITLKKFLRLKGLLNMPAKGKIVSRFGPKKINKLNVVNIRNGIDIKTDRGEPIHAVSFGKVLYASWFKGYGNMIIIDHGDSYYTIYAHAEELFKSKGDIVETDEVIATVGDSGSMIGPVLYFEVRHHGKPMDPLKWVKKG